MNSRLWIAFSFILLAVCGCRSLPHVGPDFPWIQQPQNSETPQQLCSRKDGNVVCTEHDALQAFLTASEFCRTIHDNYAVGATAAGMTQGFLGIFGTLAGAVFSPIATGTAKTAWSGLSGATNALQSSMETSLSASMALKRQVAVANATRYAQTLYVGAPTPADQVRLALAMANSCWMAGSIADLQILNAVASPVTQPLVVQPTGKVDEKTVEKKEPSTPPAAAVKPASGANTTGSDASPKPATPPGLATNSPESAGAAVQNQPLPMSAETVKGGTAP